MAPRHLVLALLESSQDMFGSSLAKSHSANIVRCHSKLCGDSLIERFLCLPAAVISLASIREGFKSSWLLTLRTLENPGIQPVNASRPLSLCVLGLVARPLHCEMPVAELHAVPTQRFGANGAQTICDIPFLVAESSG